MAGDTPAEAVRAFVDPIQDALGCFASGKVTADSFTPGVEGVLTFNRGDQVRLLGDDAVYIEASMRYDILEYPAPKGPWKVSTAGWIYTLYDRRGGLIAGYHWHPVSDSHVKTPHVHLAEVSTRGHYPTGRVLIEDVLTLATEHGAKPRDVGKWDDLKARNLENFAKGATWGVGPDTP